VAEGDPVTRKVGFFRTRRFRAVLRFFSRAGFVLFVACSVPALWLFLAEADDPLYFGALDLHVVAGWGLLAIALPSLLAHLWLTGSRPLLPLLVAAVPLVGLWAFLGLGGGLRYALDGYLYPAISAGSAAGWAALGLVATAAAMQVLPRLEKAAPTRWSGLWLSLAAGTAIGLGLTAMEIRGDARWGAVIGHSALGLLTLALIAPHFRAVRKPFKGRLGAAVGVTLLASALVVGAWALQTDRTYYSGFTEDGAEAHWRTLSTAKDALPAEPMPADVLGRSASCGEAGCHEELVRQWEGSAHRFSADNALFRASVARFVRDHGPEIAILCANCHDPERSLGGTVLEAYADGDPPPGDGVSCVACHSAYDAPTPTGNGVASYRVPRTYPGADEEERNARLMDAPRLHRQSFQASRHLMSDEGCGVCHRLELGLVGGGTVLIENTYRAEEDPGPEVDQRTVSCGLCHMPTRTPQAGGRMALYDHRWPGINVDLAAYVTHPDADFEALAEVREQTEIMIAGGLDLSHLPDSLEDNPEYARYAELAEGRGLLKVELSADRSADGIALEVRTSNHRSAHRFPIGPFDLQEVWMEVTVRHQRSGAVLAHVGGLSDGRVDPAPPRLGARDLDVNGEPIREHRLDELASVADKRSLWPGEVTTDLVTLPVIADAGPVVVEVGWNFRRANPDFAAFALGAPDAGERFGVHRIGGAELALP